MKVFLLRWAGFGWRGLLRSVKRWLIFYSNQFKEYLDDRPLLDGVSFRSLYRESACLAYHFVPYENNLAIASCDGNKSLWPDGFDFYFLNRLWLIFRGGFKGNF